CGLRSAGRNLTKGAPIFSTNTLELMTGTKTTEPVTASLYVAAYAPLAATLPRERPYSAPTLWS
ncbi:MAG TPA: hypothetical protein VFZ99_05755, partial [Terriglobales bacterium]